MAAADKLMMAQVPVIRIRHLSAEQAKAFAIADNRLAELATWDDRLLGQILGELAAVELDFSLEVTGFTMGEIDLIIEGISESPGDEEEPLEPPSGPPVSRPGDLWLLDRHRVLRGNSLERASFETLMQGELAQAVFADPPYNVPIQGHASGNGKIRHREFAMHASMTPPMLKHKSCRSGPMTI